MIGIPDVDSAIETDQLEARRYKMESGDSNLPSPKSEEISGNETPRIRNEITKEETRSKYGGSARKMENAEHFYGVLPRGFRAGVRWWGAIRLRYRNTSISAGRKKTWAYVGGNRELEAGFS